MAISDADINPKTGEPFNEDRAERVTEAIAAYAAKQYGDLVDRSDNPTVVQDFVTDVCHWADQHKVNVHEVVAAALRHFVCEVRQEDGRRMRQHESAGGFYAFLPARRTGRGR